MVLLAKKITTPIRQRLTQLLPTENAPIVPKPRQRDPPQPLPKQTFIHQNTHSPTHTHAHTYTNISIQSKFPFVASAFAIYRISHGREAPAAILSKIPSHIYSLTYVCINIFVSGPCHTDVNSSEGGNPVSCLYFAVTNQDFFANI